MNPFGQGAGVGRDRLPRGTHGIDPAAVLHSQRMRLHLAVLEAVARRGFTATTVADILAGAKVSRRTFYQLFRGRDDCFAEAFDVAVAYILELLDAPRAEQEHGSQWHTPLRRSLETYLRALAENGECARALHVESLVAGPIVAERRRFLKDALAQRMRAAFDRGRRAGDIPAAIPAAIFDALIGAIDDRIRDCLDDHGPAALPALAPQLHRFTLALFGVPEWPAAQRPQ
ncbi:TetR/AcrR family transcriptional regulator [Nocardia sp. NPDC051570]|uniref:TetR/AcrR family transcriptional regulator n=1 Tax=Nocardia sp. NPDC051570 TaxID=3364324 RepID=UPI0037968F77